MNVEFVRIALKDLALIATSVSAIFVGYQLYQSNEIERNKAFFAWQKAEIVDILEENGSLNFSEIARKMSKKHRVMKDILGVDVEGDEETRMALLSLTSDGAVVLSDSFDYMLRVGVNNTDERLKKIAMEDFTTKKESQIFYLKMQRLIHQNPGIDIDNALKMFGELSDSSIEREKLYDMILDMKSRGVLEIYEDGSVFPSYSSKNEITLYGQVIAEIVKNSGETSETLHKEVESVWGADVDYDFILSTIEELRRDGLALKDKSGNVFSTYDE